MSVSNMVRIIRMYQRAAEKTRHCFFSPSLPVNNRPNVQQRIAPPWICSTGFISPCSDLSTDLVDIRCAEVDGKQRRRMYHCKSIPRPPLCIIIVTWQRSTTHHSFFLPSLPATGRPSLQPITSNALTHLDVRGPTTLPSSPPALIVEDTRLTDKAKVLQ